MCKDMHCGWEKKYLKKAPLKCYNVNKGTVVCYLIVWCSFVFVFCPTYAPLLQNINGVCFLFYYFKHSFHEPVQIWHPVSAEAHTVFPCVLSDRHTCCCPAPSGLNLSLSWIGYDPGHLCTNCWGQTGSVAYALRTSYCISFLCDFLNKTIMAHP